MKLQTVSAEALRNALRLDSWFFLSPANISIELVSKAKLAGLTVTPLARAGPVSIWKPGRSKLVTGAPGQHSAPYLRPYDVFNYFPEPADWISRNRTAELNSYLLKPEMILQTCSGRNLGPSVVVDRYLSRFVIGGDMIRIEITDDRLRKYIFAYLNSDCGRSLMRKHKTGSVIDHLDPRDLQTLEIAFLPDRRMNEVVSLVTDGIARRERGRLALYEHLGRYEANLPSLQRSSSLREGWSVSATDLKDRIDAASYDPLAKFLHDELLRIGGKRVAELGTVRKPATRYKTCYVTAEHGRPLLSGAQLMQARPINLQFMAPAVFKSIADYELAENSIAYPADGRAEEELGTPALITQARAGWLASGHIGRVIPKAGVNVGSLFLAIKSAHAQIQLKARASGSVVDSTFVGDMEKVVLPPLAPASTGNQILSAWVDMVEGQLAEERASKAIDEFLLGL